MPGMSLRDIVRVLDAEYIGDEGALDESVRSVTMDSRTVTEGALFFAIRGERVDGHSFIGDVFNKGALAVICERDTSDAGNRIVVKHSIAALQRLAAYYRTCVDAKVVLITGSVGKTSTKEMIASVLGEKYNVLKTEGNFNNEIGLPLTVFRLRPEHEVAVLEAGVDEPGEMDIIAKAAKPDVCVITNIGICHMENLGSRRGIFEEKSKCFDYMRDGGIAVLNGDDDILGSVRDVRGVSPVFFGVDRVGEYVDKQVYVTDVVSKGFDGSDAVLHTGAGNINVSVGIPGVHQITNAAAAAAVGLGLGLSLSQIASGIAKAKTISGRTNLIHTDKLLIVDDCYNANPSSMKAGLFLLVKASGRRIAVLGDMGELGPDERALHREVGEYAAGLGLDALFLCGELSKEIMEGAKADKNLMIRHFPDREKLTEELLKYVQEGDTVLVKASHFMQYQAIVDALTKYV
ncbi:MAG: UDP-N-acetylmuramoyl-tripeptide--D-alanyl-D-alanine ligase [Lachnospiraceae bacterium]|nr:UDP-N-acetylmuramoyl-tripeptide--D-alanyl-D-alanine ligase [Lachnospiraceae bacterium]